ncbi:MAG: aspartate aminotransferase family protein [Nitrospirae bacterium]|nr:aspartate aminotransferase family protein [Nitrospirota bacterium]
MDKNIIKLTKEAITPALVVHANIAVKKASGIYLDDIDGNRYMDFTSGLATTNTGHNHPAVVEAIRDQAGDLIHSGCMFYHKRLAELAQMLKKIMPPGLDMFFFSNSGAEAIEGALKLARFYTGRQGIIAFTGGFHGRTFGAATLTTSSIRYRKRYHPMLPSVYHSPYPYCYRCWFGQKSETCSLECFEYLERLFRHQIPPDEVACIVIEPVLGEGGYVVPPRIFLERLRGLCNKWGILLVFDEVQSGMGRTGKWFACGHFGITPDIMTVAKGIASGMPLSAVISQKKIMLEWPPGAHGTTFGGNPVSCAAAIATISVMEKEGMLENAARAGGAAIKRLKAMQVDRPAMGDVRGLGLMIGIELVKEGKEPDTEGLKNIISYCLDKGLLLLECGADKNIIRLAPPLIITGDEMNRGLDILEEAIGKTR